MTPFPQEPFDVVVVGGGPAGLSAALWAARYRRRVVMIDAGQQRNRWTTATHGYFGLEGVGPARLIEAGHRDLDRYPEVDVIDRCRVTSGQRRDGAFELELEDGRTIRALRVVLATGVRDLFPDVGDFDRYYGRSIFTCPSCDGYEAQGKAVAVVGETADMAEFAMGLLDWARSVVVIRESGAPGASEDFDDRLVPVGSLAGRVVEIDGQDGHVRSLVLEGGRAVPCDVVFWLMKHEQQSDLARQLGCELSTEGCVVVDDRGATTASDVYAAGDMTPGPHLVQIAAAEGARAGISAAVSLHGQMGSPMSPPPAPVPGDA
jgi:thioredoxin reductase